MEAIYRGFTHHSPPKTMGKQPPSRSPIRIRGFTHHSSWFHPPRFVVLPTASTQKYANFKHESNDFSAVSPDR